MENKVKDFIDIYGTECLEKETISYIELMMDNHFCIVFNKKEYYIPEDNSLMSEEDLKILEYIIEHYLV